MTILNRTTRFPYNQSMPGMRNKETGPRHEARLAAPLRGCGCVLIFIPFVELISAISFHLSTVLLGEFSAQSFAIGVREQLPLDTKPLLWILIGIGMASASTRLRVANRELRMRRLFVSSRVELNRMSNLWFYPSFPGSSPGSEDSLRHLAGTYYVEAEDGSSIQFKVHRAQLLDSSTRERFVDLIQAAERMSGSRWTTLADPMARRHLPELSIVAQLTRVTGRTGWSLVMWLFQNSLAIHLSRTGVVTSQALLTTITFWISALVIVAVSAEHLWQSVVVVAAYLGICLSLNLLVLMIGAQRRHRQRVQGELEAGREIQRQLLPRAAPVIAGFDLRASYVPAREIAGDYWDVVEIAPRRWALVIADVAGKGAPAALVASLAKGHLAASLKAGVGPLAALDSLNREIRIAPKRRGRLFMTMILMVIDEDSGSLSLIRAGHEPPLVLRRGGEIESIEPRGLAIGIDPGSRFLTSFDVAEIDLAVDESIVLFTDGLTEAMNPQDEQFGDDRLRNVLRGKASLAGSEILDTVTNEVAVFRAGAEPSDDMTLLVLRRERQH